MACCRFSYKPTAECGPRLFGVECVGTCLQQNFKLRPGARMRGKALCKSLTNDRERFKRPAASSDSADPCAVPEVWRGAPCLDANNIAEIGSIYPGCCVERAIHIHFEAHIGYRAGMTNQGRPTIRLALTAAYQIGGPRPDAVRLTICCGTRRPVGHRDLARETFGRRAGVCRPGHRVDAVHDVDVACRTGHRPPRLALADCHAGSGINRAASVFADAPSASCKPIRSAAAPLRPSSF